MLLELGVGSSTDVGGEVGFDEVVDGERAFSLLGFVDDSLGSHCDTGQVIRDVGSRSDDESESLEVRSSFGTRSPARRKRTEESASIRLDLLVPFLYSPVDALSGGNDENLIEEVVDLVSGLVCSSKEKAKTRQ